MVYELKRHTKRSWTKRQGCLRSSMHMLVLSCMSLPGLTGSLLGSQDWLLHMGPGWMHLGPGWMHLGPRWMHGAFCVVCGGPAGSSGWPQAYDRAMNCSGLCLGFS